MNTVISHPWGTSIHRWRQMPQLVQGGCLGLGELTNLCGLLAVGSSGCFVREMVCVVELSHCTLTP